MMFRFFTPQEALRKEREFTESRRTFLNERLHGKDIRVPLRTTGFSFRMNVGTVR